MKKLNEEMIVEEISAKCKEKKEVMQILYEICKTIKYDKKKTIQRIINFYKKQV